jgi:sensor domain CHASE-containing protein
MIDYNDREKIDGIRKMAGTEGGLKLISFISDFVEDEISLDSIDLNKSDQEIGSIYRAKRIANDIITRAIDMISPIKGD